MSPSSALIRRDLFESVGYFDESFEVCEDYDFWLRISLNEEFSFVQEPLTLKHGGHSDQLLRKYWGMDRFRIKAIEKILVSKNLNKTKRKLAYLSLISKLIIVVNGARKRGNQSVYNYYSWKLIQWHRSAHLNFKDDLA